MATSVIDLAFGQPILCQVPATQQLQPHLLAVVLVVVVVMLLLLQLICWWQPVGDCECCWLNSCGTQSRRWR